MENRALTWRSAGVFPVRLTTLRNIPSFDIPEVKEMAAVAKPALNAVNRRAAVNQSVESTCRDIIFAHSPARD